MDSLAPSGPVLTMHALYFIHFDFTHIASLSRDVQGETLANTSVYLESIKTDLYSIYLFDVFSFESNSYLS